MNTIDLGARPRAGHADRDVTNRSDGRRRRRGVTAALGLLTVSVVVTTLVFRGLGSSASPRVPLAVAPPIAAGWTLDAYRGLATWIDVFDYTPDRAPSAMRPPITAEEIEVMAIRGVRTVFLQAATTPTADDDHAMAELLSDVHDVGLRAVVWYVPGLEDIEADVARLRALRRFEVAGERFDGMAVALWPVSAVADPAEGQRRLLELSRRVAALTSGDPVGAILPAANASSGAALPLQQLSQVYDVWLPLAYWSVSGEDPSTVVVRNLTQLRSTLTDDVAVHIVGGVADAAQDHQYARFATAVRDGRPIGASIYDYATTSAAAWAVLEHDLDEAAWGTAGLRE